MKLEIRNFRLKILKQCLRIIFINIQKKKLQFKIYRAFTLIEVLIVMFILASSMTAALYLLTTVVLSTQQNLKRTKAVYLAQECAELARNIRDSAWQNYRPWDCAFGSVGNEFILSYDYSNTGEGTPIGGNCNNLRSGVKIEPFMANNDILWQSGAQLTHQTGGDNSGYRRRLKHVDPDSNSATLDLECYVDWDFNGRSQSIVNGQTLTNWRKN